MSVGFFKDSAHKYNVNTVIFSVIAACISKQTRHENTASDTVRLISWHLSLIPGIFCIKEQNQLELKTVKKKKKKKEKRKEEKKKTKKQTKMTIDKHLKLTLINPALTHLCNSEGLWTEGASTQNRKQMLRDKL